MVLKSGTLAEPIYATGEFGKTRELPAGTPVEVVSFSGVKSCREAATILARDPQQNWMDTEVWYVTASALRFEGALSGAEARA